MASKETKYTLLSDQPENDRPHHGDDRGSRVPVPNKSVSSALVVVAIISCLSNLIWVFHFLRASPTASQTMDTSLYAGLERDVPTPYRLDTIFAHHNRSVADAAWDSWVVDPGIVALPHEWVKAKMLPQSQHWPWDKDKGIYLLNGFHNLHCLVSFTRCFCLSLDPDTFIAIDTPVHPQRRGWRASIRSSCTRA